MRRFLVTLGILFILAATIYTQVLGQGSRIRVSGELTEVGIDYVVIHDGEKEQQFSFSPQSMPTTVDGLPIEASELEPGYQAVLTINEQGHIVDIKADSPGGDATNSDGPRSINWFGVSIGVIGIMFIGGGLFWPQINQLLQRRTSNTIQ